MVILVRVHRDITSMFVHTVVILVCVHTSGNTSVCVCAHSGNTSACTVVLLVRVFTH